MNAPKVARPITLPDPIDKKYAIGKTPKPSAKLFLIPTKKRPIFYKSKLHQKLQDDSWKLWKTASYKVVI